MFVTNECGFSDIFLDSPEVAQCSLQLSRSKRRQSILSRA